MNNTALKAPTASPSMEESIKASMMAVVESAKAITVTDNTSYLSAADTLKAINERRKQVEEYWRVPKSTAAQAHKEICAKEKAMLTPLTEAETALKRTISDYNLKIEAQRKAEAAELERKKEEERERLLADAVAAEQTGDIMAAETSLLMAEMVEDMKSAPVTTAVPKAEGISVRKTWKAKIIDDSKVPTHVGGVCIRPVDMTALNNFARMTKGSMEIPGVEFYEDASLAVR